MTSPERKALEAQFAIGLKSAAALAAQGKSVCCVINESRDDGTTIVRMNPEFQGRLQYGTELYFSVAPQPSQQGAQWVSIAEQLPNVGAMVLTYCKGFSYPDTAVFQGPSKWAFSDAVDPYWDEVVNPVTHWMPLPCLPDDSPQPAQQPGSPT